MNSWKFWGAFSALFLFLVLGFQGCYFDNEEDLYPVEPCDTTNITYSGRIQPILSARCYDCHSDATFIPSGSGISFQQYVNLKDYLDNFSPAFLGVIRHEPGFIGMPKDEPRIPDCEIKQIEIWIANGYPDN